MGKKKVSTKRKTDCISSFGKSTEKDYSNFKVKN